LRDCRLNGQSRQGGWGSRTGFSEWRLQAALRLGGASCIMSMAGRVAGIYYGILKINVLGEEAWHTWRHLTRRQSNCSNQWSTGILFARSGERCGAGCGAHPHPHGHVRDCVQAMRTRTGHESRSCSDEQWIGCPPLPHARWGQQTGAAERPRHFSLATVSGAPSKCDPSVDCGSPRSKDLCCPPSNRQTQEQRWKLGFSPLRYGRESPSTPLGRSMRNSDIRSPCRSVVVRGVGATWSLVVLAQPRKSCWTGGGSEWMPRVRYARLPRLPCGCAASVVCRDPISAFMRTECL
jgi:hypothetical protein